MSEDIEELVNNLNISLTYAIKTTLGPYVQKLNTNNERCKIITNILKGQDKQDLWDDWSKQSKQYNYRKNLSIWKSTKKILFDILSLKKEIQDLML
jgi:hypothetical protein